MERSGSQECRYVVVSVSFKNNIDCNLSYLSIIGVGLIISGLVGQPISARHAKITSMSYEVKSVVNYLMHAVSECLRSVYIKELDPV